MEIASVVTRTRRKRVHSTKCPCCAHELGKPELKANASRKRKSDEIRTESTPLLKTKRSLKSARSKKANRTLESTDSYENTANRVLRSGQNTPVCMETNNNNEKHASQKSTSSRERKTKNVSKVEDLQASTTSDGVKLGMSGIKKEKESEIMVTKSATTYRKTKCSKKTQQSKVDKPKSKTTLSRTQQTKGIKSKTTQGGKHKVPIKSTKVTKNKVAQLMKTKALPIQAMTPKKTSAIEKLKVRAFDQLKEKLEIAIDRSSLSVPECVKLLQQITSPNLSEIFYNQPASVDEGSPRSLVDDLGEKSLPRIFNEGMRRNATNANDRTAGKPTQQRIAENLSTAAQALVSFKSQAVSSNTGMSVEQPSSKELINFNTTVVRKDLLECKTDPAVSEDEKVVKSTMGGEAVFLQACTLEEIMKSSYTPNELHSPIGAESPGCSLSPNGVKNKQVEQNSNPQTISHGLTSQQPLLNTNHNQSTLETNQLFRTVATVNQMPKSLIPTANEAISTTNPLPPLTGYNTATLINPSIPITKQFLQRDPNANSPLASANDPTPTVRPLTSDANPPISIANMHIPTANPLISRPNSVIATSNQIFSTVPTSIPRTASKTSSGFVTITSPNVLVNHPQLAFQPLHGAKTDGQATTRFVCPATIPCNSTRNQVPTASLTQQRLFLPQISPPIDQKTLGSNLPKILPAVKQPTDLLLPKTTATQYLNGTIVSEVPNSCKLRPILPRNPLVSATYTLFNPVQTLPSLTQPAAKSKNVKQAVKRLVNGRTKNITDKSQQTTCLPDIASTFTKGFSFPVNPPGNLGQMIAPAANNIEMTNKEQAIRALLSIGGEQQTRQQTQGAISLTASKKIDEIKSDDSLVVFDTDKGIFKVDDVTIDPQVNTIGKESYTCGKCGKIFTSLSYLARHIKRVCPDMTHRKWKCSLCDKAFRHPFGLQQHVFTHTGERPHKCSQCPKAFYSSNDLRRHSRIHSGERPYRCKHCGKTFATTISLKTHTFIHTGEKPHRCPHCPKTFATSSKLGRHIVTHSEQRPFSCSHCPKTFNRSGDLRRHNMNIHEGKASVQGDVKPDKTELLNDPAENLLSKVSQQKSVEELTN